MKMVLRGVVFLCALYVLCDAYSKVNIKNVVRTIDLTTPLTKVSNRITVENIYYSSVECFLFSVEDNVKDQLAYFHVQIYDSSNRPTPLKFVEIKAQSLSNKQGLLWLIYFKDVLQPGKTVDVDVEIIFSHQLEIQPETVTENEKQLVVYYGNHYLYSPYTVIRQSTTVNFGNSNIESYSELAPVSKTHSSVFYGPYEKVTPLTEDKMTIYYENTFPEGSHDTQLLTPYPAEDSLCAYLDLDADNHPTVTLCKNYIQDCHLRYPFPGAFVEIEILLVILFFTIVYIFYQLFSYVITCVRLYRLIQSAKRSTELCKKFVFHYQKREQANFRILDQIVKFKVTKVINSHTFLASVTVNYEEFINETALIEELYIKMKADRPELANSFSNLQIIDYERAEQFALIIEMYFEEIFARYARRSG